MSFFGRDFKKNALTIGLGIASGGALAPVGAVLDKQRASSRAMRDGENQSRIDTANAKQDEKRKALEDRLKQRKMARDRLGSMTEGTTLSRPTTGDTSLLQTNNTMPSLLGDY